MPSVQRVLDPSACSSLEEHLERGGGTGIDAARRLGPGAVIDEVEAAGLRGRGGAGFPTATKWRTVAENRQPGVPLAVVVNAAEGEPGSFKDRMLIRRNPYRLLEGALIAASAICADEVIVATKRSFTTEIALLEKAMEEIRAAGWPSGLCPAGDPTMRVATGPSEYLFGEETALLEVVSGRLPFPRVVPPYRRGIDAGQPTGAEAHLTGPNAPASGEPVLVNNVETLSHVAQILAHGPDWFREMGTPESPGTVVCTISGAVERAGVAEFPMGTSLREVVETIGGGPRRDRRFVAALSGVANALLPADRWDAPLTYEDMRAAGSGLGAGGFVIVDDSTDLLAVVEGVSHFLSVESCGQCTPCKADGLVITRILGEVREGTADESRLVTLGRRLSSVTDGARCSLATQHQAVVDGLLDLFPEVIHAEPGAGPRGERVHIAAIASIEDGVAVLDPSQEGKQPDWTHDAVDSGTFPADRLDASSGAPSPLR